MEQATSFLSSIARRSLRTNAQNAHSSAHYVLDHVSLLFSHENYKIALIVEAILPFYLPISPNLPYHLSVAPREKTRYYLRVMHKRYRDKYHTL